MQTIQTTRRKMGIIFGVIVLLAATYGAFFHQAGAAFTATLLDHAFSTTQKEYHVKYKMTGILSAGDTDTHKNFILMWGPKLQSASIVSTPVIASRSAALPAESPSYAYYVFNLCYFSPQPNTEFVYKLVDTRGVVYREDFFTAPNRDYTNPTVCPPDQTLGIGSVYLSPDGQFIATDMPLNLSLNIHTDININVNTILSTPPVIGTVNIDPNQNNQNTNTYTIYTPPRPFYVNRPIPDAVINLTPQDGTVSLPTATYNGKAKITVLQDGKLSLKVRWGKTSTNLAYTTSVYANDRAVIDNAVVQGVGGTLNATFQLRFLSKNTTYYYQFVDGKDPTMTYSDVKTFNTGNVVVAPTPEAKVLLFPQKGTASKAGVYEGFARVVAIDPGNVSLQVKWGKSSGALTSTTAAYVGNSKVLLDKYLLTGPGDSVMTSFSLENLPQNQTYYYQYTTMTGTPVGDVQSFVIGDANGPAVPTSPAVIQNSSTTGFNISPNQGGARTATTYTGTAQITSTKDAVTVSTRVLWGDNKLNLTNSTPVFIYETKLPLEKYLLAKRGDTVDVTFTLEGLQGESNGKTYYYAYAHPTSNLIHYTEPQVVTVYGGAGTQPGATTPGPGGSGSLGDGGLDLGAELEGGLVPCDGTTVKCTFAMLMTLVNKIIKFLIYLTVPIAVVVFAYAGFMMITGAGKAASIERAKGMAMNVFIGLIFVLAGWLIVSTIFSVTGLDNKYNFLQLFK